MAFLAEKNNQPFTCPVCKKKVKSGMNLLPPYNCSAKQMCDDCFKLLYKNTQLNRKVAKIDDSLNYATQRRNSDVFEEGEIDYLKKPEMGYEYVYPCTTNSDVINEYISWSAIVVFLKIISNRLLIWASDSIDVFFFVFVLNAVLMFVTGVLLVKKVKNYIAFRHRGASKKRRKHLLLASISYACMIFAFLYSIIFWE